MSERTHLIKSEPTTGKPVDVARSNGDRVDTVSEKLLDALKDEIFGKDGARAEVKKILHDSGCRGNSFLNSVLRAADRKENQANSTEYGRKLHGYPILELINSSSDNPSAPPVAFTTKRTESSPTPALHGMLPFLRIDGSAYTVPRSVPGGSGDACVPARKPHHKSVAPRG